MNNFLTILFRALFLILVVHLCFAGNGWGQTLKADFNGDGFADLAIGVPGEGIGVAYRAGAVNVIYGSAAGLSPQRNQFWTQDSAGIEDSAEPNDNFGSALAAGDFNGDGFADLAIGVPGETLGDVLYTAGAVNVLYGSVAGLSAHGNQFWTQDSLGIREHAERGDRFGAALAAGDFNSDGFVDLAIGVPGENFGAGAVNVLYGSPNGLSQRKNQLWNQDSEGVESNARPGESFGSALAVGDFNNDGFVDLAIGVPDQAIWGNAGAGAVNVLYGSRRGLSAAANQFWHQDKRGVEGVAEAGDSFGSALAVGDFNNDGFADLAIGVPYDHRTTEGLSGGAVNVLYGSARGLSSAGNQFWHEESPGIEGSVSVSKLFFCFADEMLPSELFGRALAVGDFNKDGFADLAIGVPEEQESGRMGAVNVLYGSAAGLSAQGHQLWDQNTAGIRDQAEFSAFPCSCEEGAGCQRGDFFGGAVTSDDFNGDGFADLAIGVRVESVGSVPAAGAVNVLYGSAGGLSPNRNQFWHQDSKQVKRHIDDVAEEGDLFGAALIGSSTSLDCSRSFRTRGGGIAGPPTSVCWP